MIRKRVSHAKEVFHPEITKFAALFDLLWDSLKFAGQLGLRETVLVPI
jgi:hypothetical protein